VLLARRPPHKHLGLKWEFPGGKVEVDESPERALIREIKEELGCDIIVQRALPRSRHQYPTVAIEMIPFQCTLAPGSPAPHPHEHTEIAWVTIDALNTYDLAPADWPVVANLQTAARSTARPREQP
jgi:8-oxo-dGTP diphosphatase